MLRILNVIHMPFVFDDPTAHFCINKNVSTDRSDPDLFELFNYTVSIDRSRVRKAYIVGIFEKGPVRLFVHIFAFILEDGEIVPIFIRYEDTTNSFKTNAFKNDIVVLNNILGLLSKDVICYRISNSIHDNGRYRIRSAFNKVLPIEYDEIRTYSKDAIYRCFTKLLIDNPLAEIRASIEGVVFQNDFKRIRMLKNSDVELVSNLEYILFNMNRNWDSNLIRQFKYQFLDGGYLKSVINTSSKVPIISRSPIINDSDPNKWQHHVSSSNIELYKFLLLISITDFDITFNNIMFDATMKKLHIKHAYSALITDTLSKQGVLEEFASLRKLLLKLIYEFQLHKHNVEISVQVKRNFYGELTVIINVKNERPYMFVTDLFMFPFTADGIDFE